jgi:hypothetical protein
LASDAYLSAFAESFLERIIQEYRDWWWNELFDQFLASPVTDQTENFPEAGEPDALATPIGPFIVVFRFINPETVGIANIRWGPNSPAGSGDLPRRL